MIEEREYRARELWEVLSKEGREYFKGPDQIFDRACLFVYFLYMLHHRPNSLLADLKRDVRSIIESSSPSTFSRRAELISFRLSDVLGVRRNLFDDYRIDRDFFVFVCGSLDSFLVGWGEKETGYLYFFESQLAHFCKKWLGLSRERNHFSAVLANTLAEDWQTFADMHCTTGEVFKTAGGEKWRRGDSNGKYIALNNIKLLDIELRMRLALYDIDPQKVFIDDLYSQLGALPDLFNPFIYMDLTIAEAVRTDLTSQGMEVTRHINHIRNQLSLLENIRNGLISFSAIIVVPTSQTKNFGGLLSRLAKDLVRAQQLQAVITLPRMPDRKRGDTIWVLKNMSYRQIDKVLMIDLSGLDRPRGLSDYGVMAEFAGRILLTYLDQDISARWATKIGTSEAENLHRLYTKDFSKRYSDKDGLCIAVTRDTIAANDYELRPAVYLDAPGRHSEHFRIDSTQITELVEFDGDPGKVVYVIGNNGEGKSLLLQELAVWSTQAHRHTVGLSFGTTDRFSFGGERRQLTTFNYEGGRTSASETSVELVARNIGRKVVNIFQTPFLLETFMAAMSLLGFQPEAYLVKRSRDRIIRDVAADVVRLSGDIKANEEALLGVEIDQRQPAFLRGQQIRTIVAFSDLSSGEQQMISIIVKLIASAKRNSLLLVDEPELSLHVSWQRALPSLFSLIRKRFECDIVIATHSPLVITEARDQHDICFTVRKRRLFRVPKQDQYSVEGALFSVFDTNTLNNRLVHERCAAIVAKGIDAVNNRKDVANTKDELFDQLTVMRRVVINSKGKEVTESVERSLLLIQRAREALQELFSTVMSSNKPGEAFF